MCDHADVNRIKQKSACMINLDVLQIFSFCVSLSPLFLSVCVCFSLLSVYLSVSFSVMFVRVCVSVCVW